VHVLIALLSLGAATPAAAKDPFAPYRIGRPQLKTVWVDPGAGRDSNSGASRRTALRTLSAAWERIPQGRALTGRGYRILLAAGHYRDADVPLYWEARHGTRGAPILIESADGRGRAVLSNMNLYDVRYLYVLGVRLDAGGGDVFHCERCDHVLLRRMTIHGDRSESQEGLKVNQSRDFYVERSDISGAWDNAVDFVSVQHGHLLSNRIHAAGDWCGYAKGGSAYIRVVANQFYDCGTGGYTAGQGSGFQWLTPPWIHYEAYDLKIYDNVVHDTEGAGLGVNGGYDVLVAYNTLYRVGSRSHGLEVTYGARSCDGQPGDDGRERCRRHLDLGGWGTTRVDDGNNYVRIPNRNVYVYDNVLYNPPGFRSPDQHFWIAAPFDGEAQAGSNLSGVRADANLRIRGNLIWNGPRDLPLGVEESGACASSNATCNAAQLRRDNSINRTRPALVDPEHGDFRPVAGGSVARARALAIPGFSWADAPQRPRVPRGALGNRLPRNRAGAHRSLPGHPGAY
jgi:hypothetical protein